MSDPEPADVREDDFFDDQSEASLIKARIVSKYFDFWAKVMTGMFDRIAYIDLFSGPGVYKSGKPSTPILILERVIKKPEVRSKLVAFFNDANSNYAEQLKKNIDQLPGIQTMATCPIVWNREVDERMAAALAKRTKMPAFTFIDPFGYKGVTLSLLDTMLRDWGCDLILFFSYTRINAAITNPIFHNHVEALFGGERLNRLKKLADGARPLKREAMVLEEFAGALSDLGCKYVLPFTFQRPDMKRTSHHLIFVTKDILGYSVMKKIMAAESSDFAQGVPSFGYAKPLNREETPLLFELDRPLDDLAQMLLDKYAGQTIMMLDIYADHSVGRRYIEKNYKDVLRKLLDEGKIATNRVPRANSFADDIIVTFPRKEPG